MNVTVKVNRALKKSKISITEINNGDIKVAEKTFNFLLKGRRSSFTLRALIGKDDVPSKVELIVWESPSRVSGKTFSLDEISSIIPGFDMNNQRFEHELELIKRKIERSKPTRLEAVSRMAEMYPDTNPEGFDEDEYFEEEEMDLVA